VFMCVHLQAQACCSSVCVSLCVYVTLCVCVSLGIPVGTCMRLQRLFVRTIVAEKVHRLLLALRSILQQGQLARAAAAAAAENVVPAIQ